MRTRHFDPVTGRFTQEDPSRLTGGLNVYGFVAVDPINFSDRFGRGQGGTRMIARLITIWTILTT